MHAYFDKHKAEFEHVKASHILIRVKGSSAPARPGQKDLTDEEALAKAQEIRKKLVDGADFAATAKAESDDVGSGSKGGSLGTFGHGQMVPPFEQAAFSLPLNQISEPVKSQFGFHIIKVEERISRTFEEAKPDLEKQLGPQMTREALDNIRKQAQVNLDDAYFGK
jgi:parvulin-like peptidyl-prolyl isomerase